MTCSAFARSISTLVVLAFACVACEAPGPVERVRGTVLQLSGNVVTMHVEATPPAVAGSVQYEITPGSPLVPGERIDARLAPGSAHASLADVRELSPPYVPAKPRPAALLHPGDPALDSTFADARAQTFHFRSILGKPYALAFMYTRCAQGDECPLVSAKFAAMQRAIAKRKSDAQLVEVTLDPAHDRPPELARYATTFGADANAWHLLTGDPAAVASFARAYGIMAARAGGEIEHDERLVLVDRRGHVRRFYENATWDPVAVARALMNS